MNDLFMIIASALFLTICAVFVYVEIQNIKNGNTNDEI